MLLRVPEERRFRAALSGSNIPVYVMAEHYRCEGHRVELLPIKIRPDFQSRAGYGDDSELLIDRRWKIEVKGRLLDFKDATDFPYATAFVDRVDKADHVQVHAYISVNKALSHFALIKTSSRPFWSIAETFDATKGHPLRVYECPVSHIRFVECVRSWNTL